MLCAKRLICIVILHHLYIIVGPGIFFYDVPSLLFYFCKRNKVLGGWGWVMSVAAALSAFGSLNGSFFSGGRVCYVAAREGHMVRTLLWK